MKTAPVLSSIRAGAVFFSFLLAGLFAFQILDVPPPAAYKNSKTCCGRVICLCKHAKGAACDFKKKPALPAAETPKPAMHGHCAMKKQTPAPEAVEVPLSQGAATFTKAPCSSHAPASVLPRTFKDYLFVFAFSPETTLFLDYEPAFYQETLPLTPVKGIEHPPRTFFFSR